MHTARKGSVRAKDFNIFEAKQFAPIEGGGPVIRKSPAIKRHTYAQPSNSMIAKPDLTK
jgi:hypothetical protein